jgi:hypothetical protein
MNIYVLSAKRSLQKLSGWQKLRPINRFVLNATAKRLRNSFVAFMPKLAKNIETKSVTQLSIKINGGMIEFGHLFIFNLACNTNFY